MKFIPGEPFREIEEHDRLLREYLSQHESEADPNYAPERRDSLYYRTPVNVTLQNAAEDLELLRELEKKDKFTLAEKKRRAKYRAGRKRCLALLDELIAAQSHAGRDRMEIPIRRCRIRWGS